MPMPMMKGGMENEGPIETGAEGGQEEECTCPKCGYKGKMEEFMQMPEGAPATPGKMDPAMMEIAKSIR